MPTGERSSSRSRSFSPVPGSHSLSGQTYPRSQTRSSHTSNDSSSTASSLLDRLKPLGGYASSRISFEDNDKALHSSTQRPPDTATESLRQRLLPSQEQPPLQGAEEKSGTGNGSSVWDWVASTVSGSVGKALEAANTTASAEAESDDLRRAMENYHKMTTPNPLDLPSWLFDEPTRQQLWRDTIASHPEMAQSLNGAPKPRGLRDVFDAYKPPEAPASQPAQRVAPLPSKATNRLKASRDATAKRNLASRRFPVAEELRRDSPKETTPRPRVGLPSGPRRLADEPLAGQVDKNTVTAEGQQLRNRELVKCPTWPSPISILTWIDEYIYQ
ncbi:hypothetical protein DXG03_002624 [Asterophora parasitica]|uniref:Uncharacterized protein n=1 Tax=Asterophora parasitica TaxID=117018 RepID=A0A9P7KEP2_9AGAR|nr:hypothetical protein DXG03_002624 [Asterophora parasitica]